MAITGSLRVTPEKLKSTAQAFNSTAGTIQNNTSSMLSEIDALSSSWTGEASTAYRNQAHKLQDDINKLVRMINEHSTDLQAMAQQYEQAERENTATAQALDADVIE